MDLVREQERCTVINFNRKKRGPEKASHSIKNCRQHDTHPNINSADTHRTGLVFKYVVYKELYTSMEPSLRTGPARCSHRAPSPLRTRIER